MTKLLLIATTISLLLFLTQTTAMKEEAKGTGRHSLPLCPAGQYLEKFKDKNLMTISYRCQSCSASHFTDVENKWSRCKPHRVCLDNEEKIKDGTPVSDTVCRCLPGFGRHYLNVLEYRCRWCENRYVATKAKNARIPGDTACCPPDSEASRNELMKLTCSSLKKDPKPLPKDLSGAAGDHFNGWLLVLMAFLIWLYHTVD